MSLYQILQRVENEKKTYIKLMATVIFHLTQLVNKKETTQAKVLLRQAKSSSFS